MYWVAGRAQHRREIESFLDVYLKENARINGAEYSTWRCLSTKGRRLELTSRTNVDRLRLPLLKFFDVSQEQRPGPDTMSMSLSTLSFTIAPRFTAVFKSALLPTQRRCLRNKVIYFEEKLVLPKLNRTMSAHKRMALINAEGFDGSSYR
uniref:LAGLIDADG homing endonuclease n=1 Tax=Romanomermis culicivorax TaxID=13658 RepID=A0A915KWF8_ROMCU